MGIFDRFSRSKQEKKFSGYYSQQRLIPPAMNTTDYLQTYSQSGWLYAAVSKIATSVAETEIIAMKKKKQVQSQVLELLKHPNSYQSQFEFMELTDTYLSLTGKCFWYIAKNGMGQPAEMWIINPAYMQIMPDPEDYIQGYIYRSGTENIPLNPDEVIFINLPNPHNPYDGVGPAQAAGYSIEIDKYANQFNRNFFFNNASPDTAVLIDGTLDDDTFFRLQQQWNDKYQGVNNAKKTAILEGSVKDIKVLSTTQRDMDFANLKSTNRDEILAIFGVPKTLLGMVENTNYASAYVAKLTFAENVVRPRLKRLQDKINNELVPMFKENIEVKFVENLPSNQEFVLNALNSAVTNGYLTKNEAREEFAKMLGIELKELESGDETVDKPTETTPPQLPGPIGTNIQ